MHRILACPYYKGTIVFNGVEYEGKHESLIDAETWQRVQEMLASKANVEKHREHHHYLKGTIYCGHCGSRLCVSYSKGKLGKVYPYYFCLGRQQRRTTCMLKARPIEVVEERSRPFTTRCSSQLKASRPSPRRCWRSSKPSKPTRPRNANANGTDLGSLSRKASRVLQAHHADAIPLDLPKAEQQRIAEERSAVRAALEVASAASAERLQATARAASPWPLTVIAPTWTLQIESGGS